VAHNILNEDELRMLLSPGYPLDEIKQPQRLRLTMKYLYQLISEIQHEKRLLSQRVDELEQQLYELYQIQEEEASTKEILTSEARQNERNDWDNPPATDGPIQITRSVRHPKPEKTSFMTFLLRR
jgi:hypothetical protein